MRPKYVIIATNERGVPLLHGLYYSAGKARTAFKKLQSGSAQGYTILYENGESSTLQYAGRRPLTIKMRFVGEYISTKRSPNKRSFFDTTEEEFSELVLSYDIPAELLKDIAWHEKAYFENIREMKWKAWKRAYLPRFFYKWI